MICVIYVILLRKTKSFKGVFKKTSELVVFLFIALNCIRNLGQLDFDLNEK